MTKSAVSRSTPRDPLLAEESQGQIHRLDRRQPLRRRSYFPSARSRLAHSRTTTDGMVAALNEKRKDVLVNLVWPMIRSAMRDHEIVLTHEDFFHPGISLSR